MRNKPFSIYIFSFIISTAYSGIVFANDQVVNEQIVEIDTVHSAQKIVTQTKVVDAKNIEVIEPTEPPEVVKIKLFRAAYKHFRDGRFQQASSMFFRFINMSTQDEENYEWAQFFFGLSLEEMQLSHASVDILADLAKRKPNTKIVAYILEMFEHISRDQAFDQNLVIQQILNDQDYEFSNPLIADFVHFYQGVNDWENGLVEWSEQHFNSIHAGSYYQQKYSYHQAKYQIYQGNIEQAVSSLNKILAEDQLAVSAAKKPSVMAVSRIRSGENKAGNEALIDDVRWTLARLYYENGDYDLALEHYKRIKTPLVEQASFLLEQAWNVYQQGQTEKAMGYLYAFEAPSFKRFFSPEFYLLKSLIYKDVCHYDSALSVVDEFQQRYSQALTAIYQRRSIADENSEEVLNISLSKEKVKHTWRFIKMLEKEEQKLQAINDKDLRDYLGKIYQLQIEESADVLKAILNEEFEVIANDLLRYEEEANLMRYEIGIDMYQRVSQTHYQAKENTRFESKDNADHEGKTLKKVVFPFQGEFWNEELANYKVTLANRCDEFKEWDVFFK